MVSERGLDLEAMLANGGAGARHLAENEVVTHYDEGPAEKMERWLKNYHTEAAKGTEKDLSDWMADVSKKRNSKLGQILNCTETRGYLEDLEDFSPHFMVDEIYGQAFCLDFLQNVNGGVSGTII